MRDVVRFGVIGAGNMGKKHARLLSARADSDVLWISGRTTAEVNDIASEIGAKGICDIAPILEDPLVDAVVVAYPTSLHKDTTIQALQAGKIVICEKPISLTIKDADAMIEAASTAASQAGIDGDDAYHLAAHYLMIGHVVRFWPEYTEVLSKAEQGFFGDIHTLELQRLSTSPKWANWFENISMSGGMTVDLMVHDFDVASALLGTPLEVTAWGVPASNDEWKHVYASIQFENGCHALIVGSHMMPDTYPFSSSMRVLGTKAMADYRYVSGEANVIESDLNTVNSLMFYDDNDISLSGEDSDLLLDPFERQMDYFVKCIQKRKPVEVATPLQARVALGMALAVRKSLQSGRPVKMSSILESNDRLM